MQVDKSLSRLERLLVDLRETFESFSQRRSELGLERWAFAVLAADPTELELFEQLRADERTFARKLAQGRLLCNTIEKELADNGC